MNKDFLASYWNDPADIPGELVIRATSKRDAIRQVRKIVRDGYRGKTGAYVALGNASYTCTNRGGRAVGSLTVWGFN